MGRIGEPFEIVPAVVYLVSAARAILSIDGGYTAWSSHLGQVATASSSCPGLIRGRSRVVH